MTYGTRLCIYSIVEADDGSSQYFSLMIHHSLFDGWCLGLILETLSNCYEETSPPTTLVSYANFIDFTLRVDRDAAPEYWNNALKGATRAVWPRTPKTIASSDSSGRYFAHEMSLQRKSAGGFTVATVLRAAWALLLGRYNDDADEITSAATVTGRQTPVSGVDRIAGPVISAVPIRAKLDKHQTVRQFVQDLHRQATEMIPYEQMGLQNIAKLGAEMRDACDVSSLLVIQPAQLLKDTTNPLLSVQDMRVDSLFKNYFTYPLVAQVHVSADRITLHLVYDVSAVSEVQAGRMAKQYESVVEQLLMHSGAEAGPAFVLNDINHCSFADMGEIMQWHSHFGPMTVTNACVHEMISRKAAAEPNKQAVFAWDGTCTYRELDEMSTNLAYHLEQKSVIAESLVPVCFEKSL
jgi:hypothetical protein